MLETMPETNSASARFRTRLDNLLAERAELEHELQDVAAAGDEGDELVDGLASVNREIERAQIKLAAAQRSEEAAQTEATARSTATTRERIEKQHRAYEDEGLKLESIAHAFVAQQARMYEEYGKFVAISAGHAANTFGSVIKPGAVLDRLWAYMKEATARNRIKDARGKPMAQREGVQSLAELFGRKRSSVMTWLGI